MYIFDFTHLLLLSYCHFPFSSLFQSNLCFLFTLKRKKVDHGGGGVNIYIYIRSFRRGFVDHTLRVDSNITYLYGHTVHQLILEAKFLRSRRVAPSRSLALVESDDVTHFFYTSINNGEFNTKGNELDLMKGNCTPTESTNQTNKQIDAMQTQGCSQHDRNHLTNRRKPVFPQHKDPIECGTCGS